MDLYKHPEKRKAFADKASEFEKKYNWNQEKIEYLNIVNDLLKNSK